MGKNLSGIFPPIATPFNSDGELLIEKFNENLVALGRFRLAGVTVLGSNGESPYLSEQEKLLLVREARGRIAADRTMIVGAGRESTRLCIDFIQRICDLGADYALVGTPCYFKSRMTDDVLCRHFSMIAEKSPIPILIYNVPQFTGVNTGAALIASLSLHENIAGMKDSSGNLPMQAEIRLSTPERFRILVGSAPTLLASLIQGACGGIVAIAGALPGQTVDLYEAFVSGNWKLAAELQRRLSPPAAAVTSIFGVPGLKVAMDLMGFYGGAPRLPLQPLDSKQRASVFAVFQEAGVMEAKLTS
jgi:4-hydroxy-2-oxoglutarate aldolase